MIRNEILGLDFDGTMIDITEPLTQVIESKFPGKYPPELYLVGTPDKDRHPELYEAKREFMREPEHIQHFPLSVGFSSALPHLSRAFAKIHLLTGRWDDQRDSLQKFIEMHYFSPYISPELLLRELGQEDSLQAKLDHAQRVGITCIVDDDPEITIGFAREKYKAVLLSRPYSKFNPKTGERIHNRPNLRIYEEPWDFAMDIFLHGGVEKLFTAHAVELTNPANAAKLFEVHKVDIPAGIRSLVVSHG